MKTPHLLNIGLLLLSLNTFSQTAVLVKDIRSGTEGSNPKSIVVFKNQVYFVAQSNGTTSPQLFRSNLTVAGTVAVPGLTLGTSILSSNLVVAPKFGDFPERLVFATRRAAQSANPIYELQNFDGTANTVAQNISNKIENDFDHPVTSPISQIELTTGFSYQNDRPDAQSINPITRHENGDSYYSNFPFGNPSDNTAGFRWVQPLDTNAAGQNMAFPTFTGYWFFPVNDDKDIFDDDKIRTRDDNGEGLKTKGEMIRDYLIGIGAAYVKDIRIREFGNQEDDWGHKMLLFTRLNGLNRLKVYNYVKANGDNFAIHESLPINFDVRKAGIFLKNKCYFKTTNNGIWSSDFNLNYKPIEGILTTNQTADSLTVAANRVFFTAITPQAPNGGLYEIRSDTARLIQTLEAGEVLQKFYTVGLQAIALTKKQTTFKFYVLRGSEATVLGVAQNVDVSAGMGFLNNNLIFSANDPTTNVGQELYQLPFPNNLPCNSDFTPPLFSNCPLTDTINSGFTATGTCGIVNWAAPSVTDNCGLAANNPTVNIAPNTCIPVGLHRIVYRATDLSGNKDSCVFEVYVDKGNCNTSFLSITCPANITRTTTATCTSVTWAEPTFFNDNCGAVIRTSNFSSGTCFPIGITNVLYTIRNQNEFSTDTCSFNVTVTNSATACNTDTQKPIFSNCPNNIVQYVNKNRDEACWQGYWTPPTATDNCGIRSVTSNYSPDSCMDLRGFALVKKNVVYTATDLKGNTATCSFEVSAATVRCHPDMDEPNVTCPSNVTVNINNAATCGTATFPRATAFDDCSMLVPVLANGNLSSGSCFPKGRTRQWYIATDPSGNKDSCSFDIFVISTTCQTDNTLPTITCPANINRTTTTNNCVPITWTNPTTSDNCGAVALSLRTSPYIDDAPRNGSCFSIGTTQVIYTATDVKNNTKTCAFNVTITNICATDTQKPVLSACPQNITVATTAPNQTCSTTTWTPPTATDNCSTPSVSSNTATNFCFPIGTRTVIYTAQDNAGNSITCSFTVTVTDYCLTVDNIKPIMSPCPANIIVTTPNATATCATVTWTAPTATDNCSTPSVSGSRTSGFCFPLGTNTVIYTATDGLNNTATCSFTVTVNDICATDNQPPVFTSCPNNITVNVVGDTCFRLTWTAPTATDNCSLNMLTSNFQSGTCFLVGTTRIIYTATDGRNNTASCSFTIVVNNVCSGDNEPPVIMNCPKDTTVVKTTAACVVVNWPTVTASDNCFTPRLTSNISSGTCFTLGTTVVQFTATDNNRNTSTCSFKVNIIQTNKTVEIDPTISNVHLFPNPTEGRVFLRLESLESKNVVIRFFDITEKQVHEAFRKVTVGNNTFEFDLKNLPNTVYLLSLYQNGVLIYKPLRFVKM